MNCAWAKKATVIKVLVVVSCSWVWWACDDDSATEAESQAQETEAPQEQDDDGEAEDQKASKEGGEESSQGDGEAADAEDAVEEVFVEVSRDIAFEPYRGVLRGPEFVEGAGRANSADQALWLGHRLASKDYDVRYVRGELGGDERESLLESMYREEVLEEEFDSGDHEAFDLSSHEELQGAASEHVWVEVDAGDEQWLPLDPAFPGADVGEAYAEPEDHYETPPEEWFQSVEFSVFAETKDGDVEELGKTEATVPELAEDPPVLVVRPIPVVEEADDEGAAGAMGEATGALGDLGGDSSDDDDDDSEPVGHNFQRYLSIGDETHKLESTLVEDDDADTALRREWIEIRSKAPGVDDEKVVRTLYPGDSSTADPSEVERRYALGVVPGPVQWDTVGETTEGLDFDIDESKPRVEELIEKAGDIDDDDEAEEVGAELAGYGDEAARAMGRLTGLRFAAASDELTGRLLATTGAARVWARPRVLITSFEGGKEDVEEGTGQVSFDLRSNRVEVVPPPGAPAALAVDLQMTRGLLDAVLEDVVMRQTTGASDSISTISLMNQVDGDDIEIRVLTTPEVEWLDELDALPEHTREHIEQALSRDRHVMLPEEPVEVAGADRWGWWEMQPDSGELIGVMESGQHQAATEYSVVLNRTALNEVLAMGLGATTGNVATLFSVGIIKLRHWEFTSDHLDEVEELLEKLVCQSCMLDVEVGAEASLEIEVSARAGCIEKSTTEGIKAGATKAVGFNYCASYREGFECATSMLLSNLRGDPKPMAEVDASVEGSLGPTMRIGCDDVFD